MKSRGLNENNENLYHKEPQSHHEQIIPKININNKLLSLPIINKNIFFSDRSTFNSQKKSLEGFKPLEDIKTRNKIESKHNKNGLNIKYLSLNKDKSKDNILLLLNKIKTKERFINYRNRLINDDLFNESFKNKNLVLLNKYCTELKENKKFKNDQKKFNNFSQTPKKLKTIIINEPFLCNTIDSYSKKENIKNKISENNYYHPVKTEIDKKEGINHKLIIHNIFFEWIVDNIISNNFYKKEELNRSYDLSTNNQNRKIKRGNIKKIKSADFSRKNNKIKNAFIFDYNYDNILKKNEIKNKIFDLFDRFKFINKDNIDENFIKTKTIQNLLIFLSKNIDLNKKNIKKDFNSNDNNKNLSDTDSEIEENDTKKILSLKDGDNFLGRFIRRFLYKNKFGSDNNTKNTNDNAFTDIFENKENINDKSFSFKDDINIKKNEPIRKEKEKISENTKINKSLNLNRKLNISLLNEKIKLIEDSINKSRDNYKIFPYRNRKSIKNNIYSLSIQNKNKITETKDIKKKHFNIVFISSPEKILKEKKTIYETREPIKKEISEISNDSIVNENKELIKDKNNTTFYQLMNKIKRKSLKKTEGEISLKNCSSENNINHPSNNTNNINENKNLKYYSGEKSSERDNKNNNYNKKEKLIKSPNINRQNKSKERKLNNHYINNNHIDDNKKKDYFNTKQEEKYQKNSKNKKYTKNTDISKHLNYSKKNNNEIEKGNLIDEIKGNKKFLRKIDNLRYKEPKKDNKNYFYDIDNNNDNNIIENNKEEENYYNDELEEEENCNEDITESVKENSKGKNKASNFSNNEHKIGKKLKSEDLKNNFNSSPERGKVQEKNNFSNGNYKSRDLTNKRSTIKMPTIKREKNNSENKNKRRGTNIIPPRIGTYIISPRISKKKKSFKNDDNIHYINKENNNNEKDLFTNQDNDTSEDTTPKNIPLETIKKDLELEKILFNKNSKRKSKTIKKMNLKFLKNKSEEEDEEDPDSELEFIKITKKKRKSLRNINSFINSLNNIEEKDLIKNNNNFNFIGTNSLSAEDMNQLIEYSTKLRELAELDDSQKTEELIQLEKEIKEKYREILSKYLIKQKYKDLTKKKDINKINKKRLKILYEKTNEEDEDEEEVEMQLKIKERKKKDKKKTYIKTKIEDSEEEEELEKEQEIIETKKEEKKLIFDNSYLFNKHKKENDVAIKKEVLDILNGVNNSDTNENEGQASKNENNYDDLNINIQRRKSILKSIFASRRASKMKFQNIRKNRTKKKPVDIYKLALFSDIVEEKKEEKGETEEDKRDKLLEQKIKRFFKVIQLMKKNEENFDYFDFLKSDDIRDKENMNRLIDFSDNISNFRIKDKKLNSKFNFLSPIKFKTKKLEEG